METVSEPTPERLKASMFGEPFREVTANVEAGSVWHVKGTGGQGGRGVTGESSRRWRR